MEVGFRSLTETERGTPMTKKLVENGVVIPLEDIYSALQEIKTDVSTVKHDLKYMNQTDERSREALELAKDAMQKALDLEKKIEKLEVRQQWRTNLMLTGVLGVLGLIVTLIQIYS